MLVCVVHPVFEFTRRGTEALEHAALVARFTSLATAGLAESGLFRNCCLRRPQSITLARRQLSQHFVEVKRVLI